jgi:uncharacterized phiE125 gp8 family phage protein
VVDAFGDRIHFTLNRTTDAASEPVSLEELKTHLRADGDDEDALIDSYILAARHKVEADTGRALLSQTWSMTLDKAPANRKPIMLPIGPVSAVSSITSYSTADASSTVATSVYRADTASVPARIVLKDGQDWPSGLRPENALTVVFVAGYGTTPASVADQQLLQAIKLLVGHWYANREAVLVGSISKDIELAYAALTQPLKVAWV